MSYEALTGNHLREKQDNKQTLIISNRKLIVPCQCANHEN